MDHIRVKLSGLNHLLSFYNGHSGSPGYIWIIVSRGLAEYQVAHMVGFPGMDETIIDLQSLFQEAFPAVKHTDFLAFGNVGADACRCIKGGNSGPCRP